MIGVLKLLPMGRLTTNQSGGKKERPALLHYSAARYIMSIKHVMIHRQRFVLTPAFSLNVNYVLTVGSPRFIIRHIICFKSIKLNSFRNCISKLRMPYTHINQVAKNDQLRAVLLHYSASRYIMSI